MAKADVGDGAALDEFLAGLGDGAVTELEAAALAKVWKRERSGVHDALIRRARWGPGLEGSSWRLDAITKSRQVAELNSPAAIMEMRLSTPGAATPDVVRFEMSPAQVDEVIAEVDKAEAQIKALIG